MQKRIFIVEDEMVIVRELEFYLQDMGYDVCGFSTTAEEAIQKIIECLPDLILMDINLMGEMDGIEVAEKVKQLADIPIVYVTAFADPELLARAKVTEPYGYILKPFDSRELHIAIEIALYKYQAEKEKAVMKAQLHQAQQMKTIATLAGGLAHNFNNILWAVMGFTELTLYNLPENSKERKNLQQALQACDRAKNIVSQFLTLSRQAEPNRSKVQLEPLIDETLTSLKESLPSNIAVDQHIEITPGLISANPSRLKEMLGHLYSNAAHAMQATGGTLGVKLEEITLNEEQKIPGQSLPPGLYWQLTITDTGQGMDQTVMDRIFDPFFTTKEVGTGLGLGLSVVYGIVRSHNGSINVAIEPDKGTTFTILLPKVEN